MTGWEKRKTLEKWAFRGVCPQDFKSDNIELHGLGSFIICLGCRVTSFTTRDAKEISKLLAMVPVGFQV